MIRERFSSIWGQLAPILRHNGLTDAQVQDMEGRLLRKMEQESPPTIALIGFTGVGKSSTLNALFNAGQPTSDVRACTQDAKAFTGLLRSYTGNKGVVNIYDMPGLGESIVADRKHYRTYERILPSADVVVWTFHAGDRAMTPMQTAIETLINRIGDGFTKHLVFAINKADAIAPGETAWNTRLNTPSKEQLENIKELEEYVCEKVHDVLPGWKGDIVSYSAKRRYHLEQLMTAMVSAMPRERQWVLNELADVADYTEFIDRKYQEYVKSLLNNQR